MKPPTPRQVEVLRLIAYRISQTGFPPTIVELGEMIGVPSRNGVTDHLRALERKGMIWCADRRARGISLLEAARPYLDGIPMRRLPIVNGEWIRPTKCRACGCTTFAPDRPCPGCRLARREGA